MTESGLFPFVRLIDAAGVPYPKGEHFLATISAQHEIDLRARERPRARATTAHRSFSKSIDDFRSNPRYGGDATREDLAFAIYALAHGSAPDQVAAALRNRDLSHKGDNKRQTQYVERTIEKALTMTEGKCQARF